MNLVGVDVEEDGISIEKLACALEEHPNTKLVYVIPNFQDLFDDHHLLNHRLGRTKIAYPHPGGKHLGEAAAVKHDPF